MRIPILLLALICTLGCAAVSVPPRPVSGTARDAEGSPVSGATVALQVAIVHSWGIHSRLLELTRTDRDGRFAFSPGLMQTLHFAGDRRMYWAIGIHRDYSIAMSRFGEAFDGPLDLVLAPTTPDANADQLVCTFAVSMMHPEDYRRLAQFHLGSSERCDAYGSPAAAP
jgi:hypothetical protein